MLKGRLQLYYHSKLSRLPVRDVTNSQGEGPKTEPHLEIGAENYICSCMQPNIRGFCKSDEKYLFLFTNCKNRECKDQEGNSLYNRRLIVGYIRKERYDEFNNFYVVYGTPYIVSFEYSVDNVKDLGFARTVRAKKLTVEQIKFTLEKIHQGPNIIDDIIKEINRLDPNNKTCLITKKGFCVFQDICRRRNLLKEMKKN